MRRGVVGCGRVGGAGVDFGVAGEVRAVGGGNCTEGIEVVAVPEGGASGPGAPELFAPPLPHPAIKATESATHTVNAVLANVRADISFTACHIRADQTGHINAAASPCPCP